MEGELIIKREGKKIPTRLLAVDYGLARIGLALSDETKTIALPLVVLKAEKKMDQTIKSFLSYLEQLEKERACLIETLVVGLPLRMNGNLSMMADEVVEWTQRLGEKTTRKIALWDERLTSVQADRALREGGMNRKARAQRVDVTAAVLLLQNYLDAQVHLGAQTTIE